MSSKSVLQEYQKRVSSQIVKQESYRALRNSVKQRCLTRVSPSVSNQGVPQVGSLENVIKKYCFCSSIFVSAFGFVGFILFFPINNSNLIN